MCLGKNLQEPFIYPIVILLILFDKVYATFHIYYLLLAAKKKKKTLF